MQMIRASFLVATFAASVAAMPMAHADLMISINGTLEPGADPANMEAGFEGSVGGFNINKLTAIGISAFAGNGEMLEISSLDISSLGSGTLKLIFTETDLTAASARFLASFTGLLTNVSVTRSLYLDMTNSGLETIPLASTSLANEFVVSPLQTMSGPFSLTEEIDITATGVGATLSGDDMISMPEPMSLALVGSGLFGLGLIRRRRARR